MPHLENGQTPLHVLRNRLGDGIPFQFEVERIGRQVLMVRADPLPEGGWVCVFTDVTAERRALLALEESEDRYRRLTEASPDMIAVHTRGRFVFVNAAGAHLLGVASADELVGRRLLDFVHPDDHETARNSPPMPSFDDQIEFQEFVALRSDGRSFQAESTAHPDRWSRSMARQKVPFPPGSSVPIRRARWPSEVHWAGVRQTPPDQWLARIFFLFPVV
jgi:PAS domain S-box-containing protein